MIWSSKNKFQPAKRLFKKEVDGQFFVLEPASMTWINRQNIRHPFVMSDLTNYQIYEASGWKCCFGSCRPDAFQLKEERLCTAQEAREIVSSRQGVIQGVELAFQM